MCCRIPSASAARTSHSFFARHRSLRDSTFNVSLLTEPWATAAAGRAGRVAISGIGIVAPGAIGIESFRALLDAGTTAVAPIERFDTAGLCAHAAALVTHFKARDYIPPMKLRRMNTLSRFAVSAARLAIDDAGAALPNDAGVALGTVFGPVQPSVHYMQAYGAKCA